MRSNRLVAALWVSLGVSAGPPAQADLKIVQVVTTAGHDGAAPGRKMTLTPPPLGAARGTADNTLRVTLSVHGDESRADYGELSAIIDRATRRETVLDRAHRTYRQADWDPDRFAGPQGSLEVHRTGSAARLLGHPAHEYVVSGALTGYPVSGTVWTADDLKQPAIPTALGGQSIPAWLGQVPGLVLRTNLFLGVPDRNVTWHLQTQTVALSAAPLPASTFAIPAGYRAITPRR